MFSGFEIDLVIIWNKVVVLANFSFVNERARSSSIGAVRTSFERRRNFRFPSLAFQLDLWVSLQY